MDILVQYETYVSKDKVTYKVFCESLHDTRTYQVVKTYKFKWLAFFFGEKLALTWLFKKTCKEALRQVQRMKKL